MKAFIKINKFDNVAVAIQRIEENKKIKIKR